jgi:hypothetical protein
MATVVRLSDPLAAPLCAAVNALKLQIGAGSSFHLDASEVTVTAANASDLATSLTLCNQLIGVFTFHFADLLAHKVVAVSTLPALGAALDLATAITAANLMKASHNTECGSTARHYTADATNTTAAANATDQSSLNTLLNELKTDLNAHMASAPTAPSLRATAL